MGSMEITEESLVRFRSEYPDFADLCDARDAVVRAIEMHQLSEQALQDKLCEWGHRVKMRYGELSDQT